MPRSTLPLCECLANSALDNPSLRRWKRITFISLPAPSFCLATAPPLTIPLLFLCSVGPDRLTGPLAYSWLGEVFWAVISPPDVAAHKQGPLRVLPHHAITLCIVLLVEAMGVEMSLLQQGAGVGDPIGGDA